MWPQTQQQVKAYEAKPSKKSDWLAHSLHKTLILMKEELGKGCRRHCINLNRISGNMLLDAIRVNALFCEACVQNCRVLPRTYRVTHHPTPACQSAE